MKSPLDHIIHLFKSTGYTLCGLKVGLKQTPVQQELLMGLVHFILIAVLHISLIPALLLSILWVQIVVTELLNTAIESVVDLASPDIHPLAKIAKDTASAAVGLLIVTFIAAWALVIALA